MTILVVDGEAGLAAAVVAGLASAGYAAAAVGHARDAIARLDDRGLRALILELDLPDADGLTVIAAARGGARGVPILVLTTRDALAARVAALDAGADDYLVKPVAPEELAARLRAVLRRVEPGARPAPITDVELRPGEPGVRIAGRDVALSPRERALLELLVAHVGQVVSRADILRAFGYDADPRTNVVEVHLVHLRRKLSGARLKIQTVRGFGYRAIVR